MTLKERITARLKAKAAGEKANLSQKRLDAIVLRAEKGLTDESDDTAIDANIDAINELTPFKEIAAMDDHQRAKEAKEKAEKEKTEKEAAEKAAKEGKVELPDDAPAWMKTFMEAQAAQTKALTDQIAAFSGEKVATTRREQYAKTLEGTSEAYKTEALKDFDRLSFKDDADYQEWATGKAESVKAFIQDEANNGLGIDRPAGGAGGSNASTKKEATEAEVDAAFANIRI
ncbi:MULTISPECIES: hypothetical protein [unclassified Pedobacter]|uniref:hypothetical protein n=1 Tax=unclassified Pedobacter TaxID=2628915 RepID=UPI001422A56F|nr:MULTISPECIES: hypothetical protein [unclassified Pedobacter]NII81740.1 hypothetical protein [Pedobacter sp. SG908]NMN35743.1 hypothetical protein [Pedobacter sp. SG918]